MPVQNTSLPVTQRKIIGCISKLKHILAFHCFAIPVSTFLIHHFSVDMLDGLMSAHYKWTHYQKDMVLSGLTDTGLHVCGLLWGILLSCCDPCSRSYFLCFSILEATEMMGKYSKYDPCHLIPKSMPFLKYFLV